MQTDLGTGNFSIERLVEKKGGVGTRNNGPLLLLIIGEAFPLRRGSKKGIRVNYSPSYSRGGRGNIEGEKSIPKKIRNFKKKRKVRFEHSKGLGALKCRMVRKTGFGGKGGQARKAGAAGLNQEGASGEFH